MINKIGDAGLTALAKAVESGALASLEYVDLDGNPGNPEPVKQAMRARKK